MQNGNAPKVMFHVLMVTVTFIMDLNPEVYVVAT